MRFTNYPTVHHQPAEQFAVGRAKRAPYFPPDPQKIELGGFVASLPPLAHAMSDRSIVPVCYGGSFAARRESFNLTSLRVWRLLARALERGDNIQEGSHVERLWAALLMRPLRRREEEVIEEFAVRAHRDGGGVEGRDATARSRWRRARTVRLRLKSARVAPRAGKRRPDHRAARAAGLGLVGHAEQLRVRRL